MTSRHIAYATTLALFFSAGAVAEEVPVIELGVGSNTATTQTQNAPASRGTELLLVVQQLQDEVRALRGQIEQQDYRLKQMERQQLDRYRDLDRRISSLSSAPQTAASADAVRNDNAAAPTVASGSTTSTSKPEMVQADAAPGDAEAYRAAFGLVRERNFPKAADAFEQFIKDYPQSARLPNAYYWLGEINLAEQKPEMARESFMQVITNFADHRKAPDAAYKLGIVYDQLGDSKKSNEYLDMVITKYPDSSAVRLAKEFKRLQ